MTVTATAKEDYRDTECLNQLCEQAIKKAMKALKKDEMDAYKKNVDEAVNLARQLFKKRYGF